MAHIADASHFFLLVNGRTGGVWRKMQRICRKVQRGDCGGVVNLQREKKVLISDEKDDTCGWNGVLGMLGKCGETAQLLAWS